MLINENNPEALFLMAILHEKGIAVDQNSERTIKYLEKAAALGLTRAKTKLAHYHYSGYSNENLRIP